jgi:ornithine carbamoyltransferase
MTKFLDLTDLADDRLERVLKLAMEIEKEPSRPALRGKTVGLVFMNPSLRTLASMQAGVAQLGGHTFLIQPGAGSWKLETRAGAVMDGEAVEHVREAIPVLAQFADALGVRCFADQKSLSDDLADATIKAIAALCDKPFINLESAVSHPCQALAQKSGGAVRETSDLRAAMDGAHVLYAKSWGAPQAYGRPAEEAPLRAPHKDWCVAESWFESAAKGAKFMHCLPVRRNVKVADEVLDGPRSAVLRQAGNRLHGQKALMIELLG